MGSALSFDYTPEFLKSAKVLSKRYKSFKEDLKTLQEEIIDNPRTGIDLGNGLRKLRMTIKSKGKGKSGGARVITLTAVMDETRLRVTFLYVYDKSDMSNILNSKIIGILKNNNLYNPS